MPLSRMRRAAALALIPFVGALAQQPAKIPLRQVRTLASTDSGVIDNVYALRPMSDGHVIVNDALKHRLVLLDPDLKTYKVLADTSGNAPNKFGNGSGGLLYFPGDSVAFVDRASLALVVVDAQGNFGRVTTPPKQSDNVYFSGSTYGVPGFDVRGRLYYRSQLRGPVLPSITPGMRDTLIVSPDSAPIIRADFETRTLDTIARVRVPVNANRIGSSGKGGFSMMRIVDPLPLDDEWAYFPDGTVAVVRGQDYHIDWYHPDGTHTATPRMPFDWRRLSDADKQRIVDSVQHAADSSLAATAAKEAQLAASLGRPAPPPPRGFIEVVKPSALPDYVPAVRIASQVRVDLDDNLWIIPSTSGQGQGIGTVFDVVNRKGEIIERVQLPEGRNLQGFGPGGVIYMSVPRTGWSRVERAETIRP